MTEIVSIGDPFAPLRRRNATLRAMLEDTRDLLASLPIADPAVSDIVKIQAEAINLLLTDVVDPG